MQRCISILKGLLVLKGGDGRGGVFLFLRRRDDDHPMSIWILFCFLAVGSKFDSIGVAIFFFFFVHQRDYDTKVSDVDVGYSIELVDRNDLSYEKIFEI